MHPITAHALLASRTDRSIFDAEVTVSTAEGSADAWPAAATALAALSGQLDDAVTEADLDNAIRHGLSLWGCGVIDEQAISDEAGTIILDLMAHCEAYASN